MLTPPSRRVPSLRPIHGIALVLVSLLIGVACATWQVFRVERDMVGSGNYDAANIPQLALAAVLTFALVALPVEWSIGAVILSRLGDTTPLSRGSLVAVIATAVIAQPAVLWLMEFIPLLGSFALLYLVPSPAILGAFLLYRARKDAEAGPAYRLANEIIGVTALYDGALSIIAFYGPGTALHSVVLTADVAVAAYCTVTFLSMLRQDDNA